MTKKQCFPALPPSRNITGKQQFFVCQPLGNMAIPRLLVYSKHSCSKQPFQVCTSYENTAEAKVFLIKIMPRNEV